MNDAGVGTQMERFDQMGKRRRNVSMHQFQQAQPKQEQKRAFHELEQGNRGEAGLARDETFEETITRISGECGGRVINIILALSKPPSERAMNPACRTDYLNVSCPNTPILSR
jgi:hypothetical protein